MKRFSNKARENVLMFTNRLIEINKYGIEGTDAVHWLRDWGLISKQEYEDIQGKGKSLHTTYKVLNDIAELMISMGIPNVKIIRKLNQEELKKYSTKKSLEMILDRYGDNYDMFYYYGDTHNKEYHPRYYEWMNYGENFLFTNVAWFRKMAKYRQDIFSSDRELAALGLTLEQLGILYA